MEHPIHSLQALGIDIWLSRQHIVAPAAAQCFDWLKPCDHASYLVLLASFSQLRAAPLLTLLKNVLHALHIDIEDCAIAVQANEGMALQTFMHQAYQQVFAFGVNPEIPGLTHSLDLQAVLQQPILKRQLMGDLIARV